MFGEGSTNIHDEERSGCPSLMTEDLKSRTDLYIRTKRRFTRDEIHEEMFLYVTNSMVQSLSKLVVTCIIKIYSTFMEPVGQYIFKIPVKR
jgi:hypothetical protein